MSKPTELVRVKDPNTGAEYAASRAHAKRAGLTITGKSTVDKHGRVIPPKSNPLATGKTTAKTTAKTAAKKES